MGDRPDRRPLGEVEPDRPVGLKCGIFDPRHFAAIGEALWTFIWAVRRQTTRDGWVLGGRWLTYTEIGTEAGLDKRTARRHCAKLKGRYFELQATRGKGVRVRVKNAKKWRTCFEPTDTNGTATPEQRTQTAQATDTNGTDPPHVSVANDHKRLDIEREGERERARAREGEKNTEKGNGAKRPPLALALDRLRDAMEQQGLGYWLEEKLPLFLSDQEKRRLFEPAILAATDLQLNAFARHARSRVNELKKIHRSYHGRFAVEDLRREVFDAPPTEDDKWAAEAAKRRKKK
jgi:hypothetical protein